MRSMIIVFLLLLPIGCGPKRSLDNIETEHFSTARKDLNLIYNQKSLSDITKNKEHIREIQLNYCSYAPENAVRYMIAQELLFGDTLINRIIKSGDLIIESGNINDSIQRLNAFKRLDTETIEKLADDLDSSSISRSVNRKANKLQVALRQGYDNMSKQDKAAAIEMTVVSNCAISSLHLFIINKDQNSTVDSTLKSIMRQALVTSLSG